MSPQSVAGAEIFVQTILRQMTEREGKCVLILYYLLVPQQLDTQLFLALGNARIGRMLHRVSLSGHESSSQYQMLHFINAS